MKKLSPVLIILLAVSTLTCTDPTTKDSVVIGELTWDGGLAIAHVLKTILETRLGTEVELVLADQPVILRAMDKGDGRIDVHPDFWMPNQAGQWNQFIAPGSRETVLVNLPDSSCGLLLYWETTGDSGNDCVCHAALDPVDGLRNHAGS